MKIKDNIKYYIFKSTPHLFFDKLLLFFSVVDEELHATMKGHNNVYVFLACDYINMGDYAITKGQFEILKMFFPKHKVHIIPVAKTYSALKTISEYGDSKDIVTIIGGGNMNELYYGYERKRNLIVETLCDYPIISFPQSIAFGDNAYGKLTSARSTRTYSQHPRLTFLARDEKSKRRMEQLFPKNNVYLTPDVVMTMDMWSFIQREHIVLSIRKDREAILDESQREMVEIKLSNIGVVMKEHDTCFSDGHSSLDELFDYLIKDYSTAKLVVTDRLHGMILAYVTGTPAIVLPNNNGKIEFGYRWIQDCGYIEMLNINNLESLDVVAEKVLRVIPDRNKFVANNKMFRDLFRMAILECCK